MNDPTQGGIPLQQVPVIPWDSYLACGLKVYHDGKMKTAIFDPQPMVTADEAFSVLCLLLAAGRPKPGPLDWKTVPEEVAKHFKFKSDIVSSD